MINLRIIKNEDDTCDIEAHNGTVDEYQMNVTFKNKVKVSIANLSIEIKESE